MLTPQTIPARTIIVQRMDTPNTQMPPKGTGRTDATKGNVAVVSRIARP